MKSIIGVLNRQIKRSKRVCAEVNQLRRKLVSIRRRLKKMK